MRQYRIFLDAGVYIAGAGSAVGGSRQILDWYEYSSLETKLPERLLQPVTSPQVLIESRRNVAKKLPRAIAILERIIHQVDAELSQYPTDEEITNATLVVPSKDAPILAAASKANVEYFVTLDRKHFKQPKALSAVSFQILLPEEFVPLIRAKIALEAEQ